MRSKQRQGFTLIELMVVIAIIGVLAGLLLVALGPARAAMRNWQCLNNLKQLQQGVHTYHTNKGHFPGSFDEAHKDASVANNVAYPWPWTIHLMPYVDQQTRYEYFRTRPDVGGAVTPGDNSDDPAASYLETISYYACPSDPDAISGPHLNYAANMGRDDVELFNAGQREVRGNGVFFNRFGAPFGVSTPVSLTIDQIKDGTGQTIMFAENRDATSWNIVDRPNPGATPWLIHEYDQGVLWYPNGSGVTPNDFNTNMGLNTPGPTFARPSSMHIGTFNVAFCDSSVRTISENISPVLYKYMMTPIGNKANPAAEVTGVVSESQLNE